MLILFSIFTADEKQSLFARAYFGNRRALFRYARRLLSNTKDAEDIVQDVYSVVAGNYSRILKERDDEGVRRFLFVCTRNRAISLKKRRSRHSSLEAIGEDKLLYYNCFDQSSFEDAVSDRDAVNRGLAAIEQLDPIYADVLWLHIQGYSVGEIAGFFNEKENTISKRLSRAKKLLRQALGVEGEEY